jgi:hypothetical protein
VEKNESADGAVDGLPQYLNRSGEKMNQLVRGGGVGEVCFLVRFTSAGNSLHCFDRNLGLSSLAELFSTVWARFQISINLPVAI